MSRDKGARFEREVARLFKDWGYNAERSAQHCGKTGQAPDVIGVPGIHIECKHVERMSLYDWYNQAKNDAEASGTGNLPTVIHKQNNKPILVTMEFNDWIRLYNEFITGCNTMEKS